MRPVRRACLLLAVLALPTTARAGNDDELSVGNRAAMSGNAVVATVGDASATWFNPAGLGAVTRHSIDVSGSVYTLRFYAADDFLRTARGARRDESLSEFVTVPTQIAFSLHLAEGVNLGLGYFAPQSSDFVLRAQLQDGEDDTSVAVTLKDSRYTAGAAVGARVAPGLRLGGGLVGHWEGFREAGSVFAVTREMGMANRIAQVGFLATGSRFDVELTGGLQWDVATSVVLAAAIRSPQLAVAGGGKATEQRSFSDLSVGAADATTDDYPISVGAGSFVRYGRYTLGIAWQPSWGSLDVEADLQPAIENAEAGVDRRMLVNARLGLFAPLSEHVRLGWGLFSDRAANRLEAQGLLGLQADYYGTTLGFEFGNRYALAEEEQYETIAFATTFAVRYAYSDADTKAIVVDRDADPDGVFTNAPTDMTIHELALYVGSSVSF